MKHLIYFILFSTSFLSAFSQCDFKIDESVILKDQHLPSFIEALQRSKLLRKNNKKHIPAFIKKELDCLCGGNFEIANPHKQYQSGCVRGWRHLPNRKLTYLGLNDSIMLMAYAHGHGIYCNAEILIVKFKGSLIKDIWVGNAVNEKYDQEKVLTYLITIRPDMLIHSPEIQF